MSKTEIASTLRQFDNATEQIFTVTLKSGWTVECRCNPKQTRLESARGQYVSETEYLERGDFLNPREIASID